MTTAESYACLVKALREIATLSSIGSLLGWDERVYMPPSGAEHRANQSSLIARMSHELFTAPRIGELLANVEASKPDPLSDIGVNLRETRRRYDRSSKLPTTLVEESAKTAVLAEHAWVEARRKSSFAEFKPWLQKTVTLKQQEAECVGYKTQRYDALLDDYEPHETTANIQRVFDELRGPLIAMVEKIAGSSKKAPVEILTRHFPADAQDLLSREVAKKVGFDFNAGRLDLTVHPFCSGIGPGDTRLTTRYDAHNIGDGFFSVLHEMGHGLYDQGLPAEHFGLPRGDAVSLGIHESQSRMWENLVGRSRAFWQYCLPRARQLFASSLSGVSDEDWLFAINNVQPSLIRTQADEVTYNLHVMIRFEIEQAMITGDLRVDDVPEAWNHRMKQYLKIVPPNDALGCLQDVHWSGGGIGYFPTYTLGNLYAAQFYKQASTDIRNLQSSISTGDFAPLLGWLRDKIHSQGMRYRAAELVKVVTGEPLHAQPLLEHLGRKVSEFYE